MDARRPGEVGVGCLRLDESLVGMMMEKHNGPCSHSVGSRPIRLPWRSYL
jgi:hypothetical protein